MMSTTVCVHYFTIRKIDTARAGETYVSCCRKTRVTHGAAEKLVFRRRFFSATNRCAHVTNSVIIMIPKIDHCVFDTVSMYLSVRLYILLYLLVPPIYSINNIRVAKL